MADYRLIEETHRLSRYKARITIWRGPRYVRQPFAPWASDRSPLLWYQAYNNSKHDRDEAFHEASLEHLVDAMCGLQILLASQFLDESYSTVAKVLAMDQSGSYDTDDEMDAGTGSLFRIQYPSDWPEDQKYDFKWASLRDESDPYETLDLGGK